MLLEAHSMDVLVNVDGVLGRHLTDGRMACFLLTTLLCGSHSAKSKLEKNNIIFKIQIIFFLRQSFSLVAQAGEQWHDLSSPQPLPPEFKRFSHLSLQSSWYHSHVPLCLANFLVLFVEKGFCHVVQAGLELLSSSNPPTLVSQSTGITGMNHPAQLISFIYLFIYLHFVCILGSCFFLAKFSPLTFSSCFTKGLMGSTCPC